MFMSKEVNLLVNRDSCCLYEKRHMLLMSRDESGRVRRPEQFV